MLNVKIFCLLLVSTRLCSGYTELPDNLKIGFATASYQIEGGWNEDGKGENIWDRLTHTSDLVVDGSTGDVADDSYHKWEEDIQLMKDAGTQIYRFSLSWSRILPSGESNNVNQAGIDYYNNLINGLLEANIEPMVTLYHWDLPQPLQDIGGWPNPLLVNYFEDYARLAFKTFGDRVTKWITFNEPMEVTKSGYGATDKAPALNLHGTADYLAAHTLLLSHARAYHIYDDEFRPTQNGMVGITLNGGWNEPKSDSQADIDAAYRANQFDIGWFAHPVYVGDYPDVMRQTIDANSKAEGRTRSRLPNFTPEEVDYVRGTSDFYGLNHYSTSYSEPGDGHQGADPSFYKDRDIIGSSDDSWPTSASGWLRVVPWGMRKILNFIKDEYNNPIIYVTENGFSDHGELDDTGRVSYFHDYISEMLNAIYDDGCNVQVYTAWSFLDNFEWMQGYTERFGCHFVDFEIPDRPRTPKASARWFTELANTRSLPDIKKYVPDHYPQVRASRYMK